MWTQCLWTQRALPVSPASYPGPLLDSLQITHRSGTARRGGGVGRDVGASKSRRGRRRCGHRWPKSSKYVTPLIILPWWNNVSVKSAAAVTTRERKSLEVLARSY